MINAFFADTPTRENGGEVYVILGTTDGFNPILDISQLNGKNGFTISVEQLPAGLYYLQLYTQTHIAQATFTKY